MILAETVENWPEAAVGISAIIGTAVVAIFFLYFYYR